jgi:hypothetical protein
MRDLIGEKQVLRRTEGKMNSNKRDGEKICKLKLSD